MSEPTVEALELPYGTIVGDGATVHADGSDVNPHPDVSAFEGVRVTFTPSDGNGRRVNTVIWTGPDGPTILHPQVEVGRFEGGRLVLDVPTPPQPDGMRLMATVSDDMVPNSWGWKMEWTGWPSGKGPGPVIFPLAPGATVDIAEALAGYLPEVPAVDFANLLAAADEVLTARDQTIALRDDAVAAEVVATQAADSAVALVAQAKGFADPLEVLSSNLFSTERATDNTVLPSGTATPSANTGYVLSDPIYVEAGQAYSFRAMLRVTWLNAVGEYISNHSLPDFTNTHTYTAPVGATAARLSVQKANLATAQMGAGATLGTYEPGGVRPVPANKLDIPAIEQSANLYNRETVTYDYSLDPTTGQPTPLAGWSMSEWITVRPGLAYTMSVPPAGFAYVYWYDKSRNFISPRRDISTTTQTRPAPINAAYARLTVIKGDVPSVTWTQGLVATTEDFWVRVGGATIPPLPATVALADEVAWVIDDANALDGDYTAPTIPDQTGLDATTTTTVHGWYDALATAHPDYVTVTDLGTSSDGTNHLRRYTLAAPKVPTASIDTPRPVLFFVAGIHGYEKAPVYHLYRFAKALCDEWETSPVLEALRWNFEIVIVPVGNPYGYNLAPFGVRKNANGVDLARNFPAGWVLGTDPDAEAYGGPSPLSEPEAVMLNSAMQAIADRAVFGASLHSFSTAVETPAQFIWNASASKVALAVGKRLVSRMSRKWRKEQAWITETATYFGYADTQAPPGSEGRQMVAHGFHGSTFEVSPLQRLDGGAGDRYSTEAMTLGYEATVNYIALAAATGLRLRRP